MSPIEHDDLPDIRLDADGISAEDLEAMHRRFAQANADKVRGAVEENIPKSTMSAIYADMYRRILDDCL